MSVQLVGRTSPSRRAWLGMTAALLVALVAGYLAGVPAGDVSPVYAVNCDHGVNFACGDGTTTSALTVSHHTDPGYATQTVVEPDDGERWAILAVWCPFGGGLQVTETAYATVSWNGSSWVLSNVTLTNDIVDIDICQEDTCDAGGGAVHAWNYKLIVEINDPGPGPTNLSYVYYSTTQADDGDLVMDPTRTQGNCYLGASVSPTSQSFGATDSALYWSSDRCTFGCNVAGASVTLYYD